MKAFKLLLFIGICCFTQLHPVSADYIVSGIYDEFCRAQGIQCESHDKYYTSINSIEIYASPHNTSPYHVADANELFHVVSLYVDDQGTLWGNQGLECWMKMDQLQAYYSHDEFMVEHQHEILEIFEEKYYEPGGYIALYNHPNSDWINSVILTDWTSEDDHLTLNYLYTDDQGVKWVYENYFKDYHGWFKLDDAVLNHRPKETYLKVYVPKKEEHQGLITILVCLVCSLTAFIILRKSSSR